MSSRPFVRRLRRSGFSHELFEGRGSKRSDHQAVQASFERFSMPGRVINECNAHSRGPPRAGLAGVDDPPNHPAKHDRLAELRGSNREGQHSSHIWGTICPNEGPTSTDVVCVIRQQGVQAVVFDRQFERSPARFSTFATPLRHASVNSLGASGLSCNDTVA